LLAVTTAAVFLGIGDGVGHPSPQTAFEFDYTDDGAGADSLRIRHAGGNTLTVGTVFVVEGATPAGANGEYALATFGAFSSGDSMRAGESVTLDAGTFPGVSTLSLRGATVTVAWDAPNRQRTVTLSTWRDRRS